MQPFCIDEFQIIFKYQGVDIGTQLMNYVSESLTDKAIYNILLITGETRAQKFI
ncbi:hypothetical protein [Staphylococcus kloosii]|uniref:hypothetical protein n=1 Tax=Staphylococcus kloosii TaxID=29384 RepID=UPI0028A3DB43|nr:hypothetical protein [Staphylococcus kloosii]MDT3958404.1 hypothetical protein [Staphylococcus kloosii]